MRRFEDWIAQRHPLLIPVCVGGVLIAISAVDGVTGLLTGWYPVSSFFGKIGRDPKQLHFFLGFLIGMKLTIIGGALLNPMGKPAI